MSQFLAQLDDLNYPNKIARKLPDGEDASLWIELAVPGHLDSDFALHFDKYLVNPDTKVITPRPDAPTGVTNDQLLEQYNNAIAEIRTLKDDNATKDATITQLQSDLNLTNQALMEFATATMPTTDTDTSESQSESTSESISESTTESTSGSAADSTSTTLSESASESESTKGSDK